MSHELLTQLADVWLTVSLKCILIYLVVWLLSHSVARARPACRSYLWLLTLFSFPYLSWLEWMGASSDSLVADALAATPELLLFAGTHACAAIALVLLGLVLNSVVRLRLLRGYSCPLDISVEADGESDHPSPSFLLAGTSLFRNSRLSTPTSFGILRPVVVLPEPPIGTIYRHFVRAALVHELIKVLRFDALWTLLARLVQCCWFAHPLVWSAFRHYCLAREQVCDRWTVHTTGDVSEYETHLLAITNAPGRVPMPMSVDTPMEFTGPQGVQARIADLQNYNRPESLQPWPTVVATTGWMLMVALLAGLGVSPTDIGWTPVLRSWPMLMGGTAALVAAITMAGLLLMGRVRRARLTPPIDGLGARSRLTIMDCVQRLEREWQELQAIVGMTARRFEPLLLLLMVVAATLSFWLIAGPIHERASSGDAVPEALAHEARWP